jgi:hypothetical protein
VPAHTFLVEERARRIGENEALFRAVNEQIEDLQRGMAEISDDRMHIVCECGELGCAERIVVPVGKYEQVRSDPALFFIVPGHDKPDVEDVVEHAGSFDVVRKRRGDPAAFAEATDPRG